MDDNLPPLPERLLDWASEHYELQAGELPDLRRDLREAAAALAAQPAGWKLVPVEPTQEMCQQGQWKAREWPKFPLRISPIYQAMLAAAPQPPAQPANEQDMAVYQAIADNYAKDTQPPQAGDDARDAERYRWLLSRPMAVDAEAFYIAVTNGAPESIRRRRWALGGDMPKHEADAILDAAIAAAKGQA